MGRALLRLSCLGVLLGFAASGCTLIGLYSGAALDRAIASERAPAAEALADARGHWTIVRTTDGHRYRGRVARIAQQPVTALVFAPAPDANGPFASEALDSLRVDVSDIKSITTPGSAGRWALGGIGLTCDIIGYLALRACAAAVMVPD